MKTLIFAAWQGRGWLAWALLPLALLHACLIRVRWWAYQHRVFKTEHFGGLVVVVGNVVAGGAGKTPLVIALVRHFQACGLKVGVVSRGYGRHSDECIEVGLETPIFLSGDEPAFIKHASSAPVFVAKKRTEAVKKLFQHYPNTELVICDDGLQHYALHRDIEIAVFDDRGVGNGWLLPAGPLREPWPERQQRGVEFVLHTGVNPAFDGFCSHRSLAPFAIDHNGHKTLLKDLIGRPLIALAGIATPEAFFSMLNAQGLELKKTFALPDHYSFADWDDKLLPADCNDHILLCTEKDAVKLFAINVLSAFRVLAVPLVFTPEIAFLNALDARVRTLLASEPSKVTLTNGL